MSGRRGAALACKARDGWWRTTVTSTSGTVNDGSQARVEQPERAHENLDVSFLRLLASSRPVLSRYATLGQRDRERNVDVASSSQVGFSSSTSSLGVDLCGQAKRSFAASSSAAAYRSETENPYKVLGVDNGAKSEKIREAYRKLALKYHPDRHTNDTPKQQKEAADMFKKVSAAYYTIGDETRRKEFDAQRMWQSRRQQAYSDPWQQQQQRQQQQQPFYYTYGRGGRSPHQEAEEIFRSVFGSGRLEDIINEMYKQRGRQTGYMGGMGGLGGMGGMGQMSVRQYMKRRPDGVNVMVNERVVRHVDGRVETTTTETVMDDYFNRQRNTTTTSSSANSRSNTSLQTSLFSGLIGQAITGFILSVIPKIISYIVRFILIGGRRR